MNNCPNCGSSVNQGDAFCKVCGTKLPLPQNNISNNTQQFQGVSNQQQSINTQDFQQTGFNSSLQELQTSQNNVAHTNDIINDDELIDSYIGKNADKLKKGNFSVNTFLFGFFYTLYRKMWLLSIIWIVVCIIADIFLPSITSYVALFINVIISIQFKKVYLKYVREQVDKIKTENPGKTKEQLMMLCSQKGGTTLLPVIIIAILYTILLVFGILGSLDEIDNNNTDNTNSSSTTVGSTEKIGDLNITIPSMLIANSYSNDTYKSYRTSYDVTDSCNLTLSIRDNSYYNDAKQYLEKSVYYSSTDTYSGISQKKLNNNVWYYVDVNKSYVQEHYYSILKNKKIYEVQFSIINDNNKTCSSAYNTVINSLKFN